jgi:transaldolase/glucose-6-phosphate isomerase
MADQTSNPLKALSEQGQSLWLDYVSRDLISSGELKRLRDEDSISGITSNPTIFEKAMAGGSAYDSSFLSCLLENPHANAKQIFERLAVEDLQQAADLLRPIYDQTGGNDGFVSLEVSPDLAYDSEGTVQEARRLWSAMGRPNAMIKVPATKECIPAIEQLTSEGVNINITLMFSLAQYEEVARAYIRGLKKCSHPHSITSVASFFVSRVDTKIDKELEKIGSEQASSLLGKIAIANSRIVYRKFKEIFGNEFESLRRKGARVQKPLWASTSTKNPAYPDVMYVEELIGPDTVNTMPPETIRAFRDHGQARGATVMEGDPQSLLDKLNILKIDLGKATNELLREGVDSFAASYKKLISSLNEKRNRLLAQQTSPMNLDFGGMKNALENRMKGLTDGIWRKDPAVWSCDANAKELADRLEWLNLPESMQSQVASIADFAQEIKGEGCRHIVLLGMGGSSLAPAVFQDVFGNAQGYPELITLDSTHPSAIRDVESRIEPLKTLFLVSSKSGTTLETLSLYAYFWDRTSRLTQNPGRNFAAITDPGTPLVKLAEDRQFRRIFLAPVEVGGRYSALSVFGIVPAALIGVDIGRMLNHAGRMQEACKLDSQNPGLSLGVSLGELALSGRDKVTFITGGEFASFPLWLEQLIAESVGKNNKGIVPIAGEIAGKPAVYGNDRVFAWISLARNSNEMEDALKALQAAGHPVVRIHLAELLELGQEMYRWEFATAAAGAVLQINPFDQPDVQLAKDLAKKAMEAEKDEKAAGEVVSVSRKDQLYNALKKLFASINSSDYLSIQAYLAYDANISLKIEEMRTHLRNKKQIATTVGFGPRFLHSTGQLHKGGPNSGVFLQLVDQAERAEIDLQVPGKNYTFGRLIRAQAEGDYQALKSRERRILRIQLGEDASAGIAELASIVQQLLQT